MQTFYKRFSVIAGFTMLVMLLIANALLIRRQVDAQINHHALVFQAQQVLIELEQAESLLKDAETGQRGFLYTGDPKYLAFYESARTQIDGRLTHLAQLTANNPRQQASINVLRALTHDKLSELAQTTSLYRSGKLADAKTLVLSDAGLLIMNHIRQVVSRLEQEESSLEATRNAQYERSIRYTIGSIVVSSVVAIFGLILVAYLIMREMRLRERYARDVRAREEWFRVTLTSIGDAVIATDERGRVTFLNGVAELLTGVSAAAATGRDISEVFPIFNEYTGVMTENPVQKVMNLGHVVGLANHTVLKHVDGHLVPIEDSAAPIRNDQNKLIGVVLVFRDVSNERKSQETLRKTEKLAAAARLAASVAHEINNPLEAVGNLLYIAKSAPDLPGEVLEQLLLAEHELERVAHITRQTLGFYRESNEPKLLHVAPLVESVLGLYSNKLKSKAINIKREFEECPPVLGMPGELRQAVSNLISNALDAVSTNGTIVLATRCLQMRGDRVVEVTIADDGPGISEADLDRIFEPFFTTKKDIGTGLGLWVTREIVERHGGSVTVRTREDDGAPGANFAIQLPCDMNGREQHSATP